MLFYLPHFNLQNYNTLASPVAANFFISVNSDMELLEAIAFSREQVLPLLVLGGGSNVVLCDDFPGLALHIHLLGKELISEDEKYFYVKAAAGENWHDFVEYCLDCGYWGLENLSLIPGSVGAAPIQNIGAYGVELQDVFCELTAIDVQSGLSVTFTRDSCQFSYRDSVFKGALKDKYIITAVTFKLHKTPVLSCHYPSLQSALSSYQSVEITPNLISDLVCEIRRNKLPDPKQTPNVGSFFKNPIVSESQLQFIQSIYPDVVFYSSGEQRVKLAAGWLIDCAGWRGYCDQLTAVHESQALVLTNPNRLKGNMVLALSYRIQKSVFAAKVRQVSL